MQPVTLLVHRDEPPTEADLRRWQGLVLRDWGELARVWTVRRPVGLAPPHTVVVPGIRSLEEMRAFAGL